MKKVLAILASILIPVLTIRAGDSELRRSYLPPARIMLAEGEVSGVQLLLAPGRGQAVLGTSGCCSLVSRDGHMASLLFDFGREIHGGIRIVTGQFPSGRPLNIRLRFGESASEACCDIDGMNGATNDHAVRDLNLTLPWLGVAEYGNTGFRFVRIDLLDTDVELLIKEVSAISVMRDLDYAGSFMSGDSRLDSIWRTAAYTVQLNMQRYIWDGIKRDRLVWIGDLHPEVMTVCNVFGKQDMIPESIDLIRDETPLPAWMHGISSYSIWWILIQKEWYLYNGDVGYLMEQRPYLQALLRQLETYVDQNGREHLDSRFLDWPSNADPKAIDCGLHALMIMAMREGACLLREMGDDTTALVCDACLARLMAASGSVKDEFLSADVPFTSPGRKQAIALMRISGMMEGKEVSVRLLDGGGRGFSTFYGYYMLEALALEGKYEQALDIIRQYWGGMLDLGATSFWEDFDLAWLDNAGRIDEIVPHDRVDVHRTYGNYCYKGFRHSLCHGWSSGPASWLIRHIVGLRPLESGCRCVIVEPHPAGLDRIEGSLPTPYGTIRAKICSKGGKTVAYVSAPAEVKLKAADGVMLKRIKKTDR